MIPANLSLTVINETGFVVKVRKNPGFDRVVLRGSASPPGYFVAVEADFLGRVPQSSHAERPRPRASATGEITGVTVHCMSSATPGTVGRRPKLAPMPASWTSVPPGSIRKVQQSVRLVFRCVASRNRDAAGHSNRACGRESPAFACRAAPAPGYRDSGYNKAGGALWLVGYYGYSWSTSILSGSSSARFLYFGYDGVSPQGNSYRAYGFPLRCLQEEGKNEATEPHRSHAPEPPPATGATSAGSVLPALAPGRHLTQPQSVLQYRAPPEVTKARATQRASVPRLPHRSWPPTPRRAPTLSGRI